MCLNKFSIAALIMSAGSVLFADTGKNLGDSLRNGLFIEPTVSFSKSSTQNVLGTSSSLTRYAGLKLGKQNDSFRYYAQYDGIEWQSAKASVLSGNLEYLMPIFAHSKLYVGASIGSTTVKGDYSGSKTKMNFGAQAGIVHEFGGSIFCDLGYRYVNTQNIEAKSTNSFMRMGNLSALNVGIGWRW